MTAPRTTTQLTPSVTGGPDRIRLLQVALGVLLSIDLTVRGSLSTSTLAFAFMAVYGWTQPPRLRYRAMMWVPVTLLLTFVYLGALSALTLQSPLAFNWETRLLRMATLTITALFLATERLHLRSTVIGVMIGVALNVPLFFLGWVPDTYAGALTGYVGDKNTAGMMYAVATLMGVWIVRRPWLRVAIVLSGSAAVWLTESRTSLTALALGLVWVALVARRSAPVRWVAAGGAVWLVTFLQENFAQVGQFADRVGSDLLRGRIAAAVEVKLGATPWWGSGLGESYVMIQGQQWLFHDAYASLRVEGGWIFLFSTLLVTVGVGLRPFTNGRALSREAVMAQGATVAVLVCAWQLGEVFYTVAWALTLALGANARLRELNDPSAPMEVNTSG